MRWQCVTVLALVVTCGVGFTAAGREYGPPDRGEPGDEMIQAYLAPQTQKIHDREGRGN